MTGTVSRRAVWLLVVAALLPYVNALPNDFSLDDHGIILQNEAVAAIDLVAFFSQDYWAGYDANTESGLYRPLTLTSFAAEYALFGRQPLPYHVTNLLLHLVVTLLAWRLLCRIAGDAVGLWGAAAFAVLPGHSEAVIAVAGRADLLAAAGSLAALWIWHREGGWQRWITGGACFALALLAKEQAVVVPGLLLVLGWLRLRRDGGRLYWQPMAVSVLVLLVYLFVRHAVLGGVTGVVVEPLDNALIELHGMDRVLAALAVATRYAALLVMPQHLSADYSYAAIDVQHLPGIEIAGGLLLAAVSLAATWRFVSQPDTVTLAMVWLVVCFAPIVNVLFPIGTILAERLTYTPSVGFALCLGWAIVAARNHLGSRLSRTLGLALLLVMGLRTAARCADWRDEMRLFQAVVESYPESARGHKGLARALRDAGQLAAAETHYRRAIEIYPRYDTAHYNLGILLHETARIEQALFHFEQACVLRPTFADAQLNRGVALFQLGRLAQALAATSRAVELRPDWVVARQNLNDVQAALDRQGE